MSPSLCRYGEVWPRPWRTNSGAMDCGARDPMKIYRIRNWNGLFENNRTRELKTLDWVPIPNKQDGDGYTLVLAHKNGPSIYGAWIAVVQIASRCEIRGTLMRDCEKPHDSVSLSRMSRFPERVVQEMLDLLSSREVNWLEANDLQEIPHNPAVECENPAPSCASRARLPEGKGREGKGNINGNGFPELRSLVGGWFRRRPGTGWSDKEEKSLKNVAELHTAEEDLKILGAYYSASIPSKEDFRRRDLETLLNNWTGEIDRAKRWKPVNQGPNL